MKTPGVRVPPPGFASGINCVGVSELPSPVTLDLMAPWALPLVMDLQGAATCPPALGYSSSTSVPRQPVARAFPRPSPA